MFIGSLLYFLIRLIDFYLLLLCIYALMSWFYNAVNTGIYEFLRKIIEPVLYPFRKLPLRFAGIDFSLMALMVVLIFVKKIIQQFLFFGWKFEWWWVERMILVGVNVYQHFRKEKRPFIFKKKSVLM